MWLLGLHHTAAFQVTQASDIYICVCVCMYVRIYIYIYIHIYPHTLIHSQHLFLPVLSPKLIDFSRWKKFPYKLSLLKIFCRWSGHCDSNKLRWHCEEQHLLSSQAEYDSLVHNKTFFLTKNVLSKFYQNVGKKFKFLSQIVRIYQTCSVYWLAPYLQKVQHQNLVCSIWNPLDDSPLNQQYTV